MKQDKHFIINRPRSSSRFFLRGKRLLALLALALTCSCEHQLLEDEYSADPSSVFEAFWCEFDLYYGAMQAKRLNWDSIGNHYRSQITETTDEEALFSLLSEMLHLVNDGHASIQDNAGSYFRSWNRRDKSYFSDRFSQNLAMVGSMQRSTMKYYLDNTYESRDVSGWIFYYGLIPYEDSSIGYLIIPSFYLVDFPRDFISDAVDTFKQADAVIIDLRFNGGGTTESFIYSLNAFASEKATFMHSALKIGPDDNDFSELHPHICYPHDNSLANKPIAICGAFSSVSERILPNGWQFRLGAQVVYDAQGELLTDKNDNYLEGIGLAPDFWCQDNYSQATAGHDPVLDTALIQLLVYL